RRRQRRVEFPLVLRPALVGFFLPYGFGHFSGPSFMSLASSGHLHVTQRSVAGGAQQPRREDRLMAERGGLTGQDDEHRLRDFLGDVSVMNVPQRRGVDETDMLGRQLRKGILTAGLDVLL